MSLNNKELNEGVSFCSETNVESGPQKIEEIKKYFSEMLNGILFVGNLNTQLIEQNEALKKQNEILLQMLLNLGITSSEIDEEIKATTDSLNTDDEENETSNVDGENETPEEDEKIKTSNVDGENEDSEEDEESKTSNVDVENETPKEDEESKTSNLDEENETPKENETSNVDGENEGFESPEKINLFLEILNDLYVSPSEETKKFLKAPTNNKEAKIYLYRIKEELGILEETEEKRKGNELKLTNTDKIKELLGAELDFEKTKKLKVLMTCVLNLNEHLESNYNDYLEEEEKRFELNVSKYILARNRELHPDQAKEIGRIVNINEIVDSTLLKNIAGSENHRNDLIKEMISKRLQSYSKQTGSNSFYSDIPENEREERKLNEQNKVLELRQRYNEGKVSTPSEIGRKVIRNIRKGVNKLGRKIAGFFK